VDKKAVASAVKEDPLFDWFITGKWPAEEVKKGECKSCFYFYVPQRLCTMPLSEGKVMGGGVCEVWKEREEPLAS
jgi:hypothetical protein